MQFSKSRNWWSRSGSNQRHPACKAGALPAELIPRNKSVREMVGLSRFELLTPRLSSVCSNQLSYRPLGPTRAQLTVSKSRSENPLRPVLSKLDRRANQHQPCEYQIDLEVARNPKLGAFAPSPGLRQDSRKEVIQPQVLLQLPCYDFTPITDHTLGACPPCGLAQRLLVQPAFVM